MLTTLTTLTSTCSLVLHAGPTRAIENDILTYQIHYLKPTLALLLLALLPPLTPPPNPKSTRNSPASAVDFPQSGKPPKWRMALRGQIAVLLVTVTTAYPTYDEVISCHCLFCLTNPVSTALVDLTPACIYSAGSIKLSIISVTHCLAPSFGSDTCSMTRIGTAAAPWTMDARGRSSFTLATRDQSRASGTPLAS